MHGSEAAGGLCKTSERSVPGNALKGHTFKDFAVKAIVDCRTPVKTTQGVRVTITTFRIKCAS